MFPNAFIDDIIILASNEALAEGAKKITKGEFLRWFGLWFLMGTVKGCKCRDFWCSKEIDTFKGALLRLD